MPRLRFATRPSKLARWQSRSIQNALQQAWPGLRCTETVIRTEGDRVLDRPLPEIGGKGLFTQELENELLRGGVDAAVHSLKDLPVQLPAGLVVGLIPTRAEASDVLISPRGWTLESLPAGAIIGTSSVRRQAQLLAFRRDLQVRALRGNVDTRVRKVLEGQYDAIILAHAGLARLSLHEHITQVIPLEIMLPAPGQGALAVQCRAQDADSQRYLSALEDPGTRGAVEAERAFLTALGGGCSLPVGAYAQKHKDAWRMRAVVASPDGEQIRRVQRVGEDPLLLAEELAREAIADGAMQVLHG
ncbi:MAG: hydroxymethylbilane synthase [Anaerolineales bacterium]